MFRHSTTETSLRLEVIISLVDASPVGQQMAHLITTDKACELSLRLTLMEYPVLAIVPPAVDIDTTHVIDFGGRGKSCDFTIKAGSVGVEPVPLWLLLVVGGFVDVSSIHTEAVDRQSAKQVLRVGEEDQYLLATGCFDMRKYVEKAVLGPAEVASFDKLTVALAPTTGAQPPVEVSLYLRMSRVGSSTTASRAVEIIELRPPAIVCATANVGTDPLVEEHTIEEGQRTAVAATVAERGARSAAATTSRGQGPVEAATTRRGRSHSTGLSPGNLRRRLSRSVEEQLRRSTDRHRAHSRSLCRSTSEKGLRLSAPFEAGVAPRLPSTAPTLHDVLADADDQYGRDRVEPVAVIQLEAESCSLAIADGRPCRTIKAHSVAAASSASEDAVPDTRVIG